MPLLSTIRPSLLDVVVGPIRQPVMEKIPFTSALDHGASTRTTLGAVPPRARARLVARAASLTLSTTRMSWTPTPPTPCHPRRHYVPRHDLNLLGELHTVKEASAPWGSKSVRRSQSAVTAVSKEEAVAQAVLDAKSFTDDSTVYPFTMMPVGYVFIDISQLICTGGEGGASSAGSQWIESVFAVIGKQSLSCTGSAPCLQRPL